MKVVLYHPEIPQNTGNIGRLCVATESELILVRPLGFFIDDKEVRRAGLDYWKDLKLTQADSLEEVFERNPSARAWFLSTKGRLSYDSIAYQKEDLLIFGSEGSGLPPEIFKRFPDSILTIPMWGQVRSLNLATAVGIVLYEAFRQEGFPAFPS